MVELWCGLNQLKQEQLVRLIVEMQVNFAIYLKVHLVATTITTTTRQRRLGLVLSEILTINRCSVHRCVVQLIWYNLMMLIKCI